MIAFLLAFKPSDRGAFNGDTPTCWNPFGVAEAMSGLPFDLGRPGEGRFQGISVWALLGAYFTPIGLNMFIQKSAWMRFSRILPCFFQCRFVLVLREL